VPITTSATASTRSKARLSGTAAAGLWGALHCRTLHPPIEADICLAVEVDSHLRVTTVELARFYALNS
jgi:hypothetical protein